MAVETGHVQLTEFSREVIPQINWMFEDLFCQYGVAMPYFLLDFDFPDYSDRPEWVTGYVPDWYLPEWKAYWPTFLNQWPNWFEGTGFNFNLDWGEWGYYLPWLNELLGLLFDEAGQPREMLPDLSPASMALLSDYIDILYSGVTQEITMEEGDNEIKRTGTGASYNAAKTDYEDDPAWVVYEQLSTELSTFWGVYRSGSGSTNIYGYQSYLSFDTQDVSRVSSAKIVLLDVDVHLDNVTEDPILYIYKFDYETLDSGDWTGGELVAEREFTMDDDEAEEIEIDIDADDVTKGDYSKYMFTLKKIADTEYWSDPGAPGQKLHRVYANTVKLVIK